MYIYFHILHSYTPRTKNISMEGNFIDQKMCKAHFAKTCVYAEEREHHVIIYFLCQFKKCLNNRSKSFSLVRKIVFVISCQRQGCIFV